MQTQSSILAIHYKPIKELNALLGKCSKNLPPLEEHHYEILEDLELKRNAAMNTNRTTFFIHEMLRYAKEQKVLRTTHMGETRGGKSEGVIMCALIHTHFFNNFLLKGAYDNVDVKIKKTSFKFTINNIHRNRTYYIEYIRTSFKNKTLVYGEVNVIDEPEESAGGLGSMSEKIEITNYNNMVAKYNLGEHWIDPRRFTEMNTSYGIHWFIKDVKNKVNWGLLYRLEAWSKGISPQSFMGWVCFPLHENEELREAYEDKKNAWINEVIEGGGDPRALQRLRAAEIVSLNEGFSRMKTHKSFVLTNDQQIDIIDNMIAAGILQNFNMEERRRILATAQLIVKNQLYPELYPSMSIEKK